MKMKSSLIFRIYLHSMIFIYGAGSPYSQECCWSLLNEYLDLREKEENSAFLKIFELKLDVDTFCYDDIFAFINS